jgi:hypothetical protein
MATIAGEGHRGNISVGRVLSRGFAVLRHNAFLVIGIALFVGAIPHGLVTYAFTVFIPDSSDPALVFTRGGIAATAGVFLVDLLLGAIVQGSIIHITVTYCHGRRASLKESLGIAANVFLPLVVLSLLFTLGLILGFVFLVIPCFIVWCMWFVAKPVLVVERTGIWRAFKRSKELTAFEGWKMLGVLLILLSIGVASSQIARLISRAIEGSDPARTFPVSYLLLLVPVSTLAYVLWPVLQAAAYLELRHAKEGPIRGHLEQVFA